MIERLLVALHYFAGAAGGDAETDEGRMRRVAGDFLDAYRLIVDCPQYDLGATARAALADVETLAELLESSDDAAGRRRTIAATRVAARTALVALGTERG